MSLALGFLLGTVIAYLSWRAGSLNRSGAWAAVLTGGLIFGLGGIAWAAVLLAFFISSSGLTRLFSGLKSSTGEKYAKGSRRDWGQVLANGSLAALLAVAAFLLPTETWPWAAFVGAMAAVTADTWATEIGVISSTPPRLITNGRAVERGSSGGITILGYLAVAGGGLFIGSIAAIFNQSTPFVLVFAALLAGLAGSTVDSLLGATVQAIYYCPVCQKETERHPQHSCGTATVNQRGWLWLNNDWVNFLCSVVGAGTAWVVQALLV